MTLSAVRRRTWALGVLAVAVAVGLCLIGAWQWRVAFPPADASTLPAGPAVPAQDLLPPGQPLLAAAVGREVTASGRYEPGLALRVTGRVLDGRPGTWQLVPLRTPSGAALPVVRAFVARGTEPPAVPTGTVTVTGRVQPPFLPADRTAATADDAVAAVDTAELVNRWGAPIHPAYVVAETEAPPPEAAPERVPALPSEVHSSVRLRNLAYAVQWFVFAGFVLLFWVRLARDDVRSSR